MISSITNFVFGASQTSTGENSAAVQLTTTPTDDEWILVDRCKYDSDHTVSPCSFAMSCTGYMPWVWTNDFA